MKQSKTTTLLFIIMVIDLVLLGGYYLWFKHIELQGKNISTITNKIDFLDKQEARLKGVKAVLADTTDSRKTISSYLISKDGVVSFVESLERLGKSVGISVSIDSLGVESLKGQFSTSTQSLALSVSGSSDWQSISRFVGMVETMPFVIIVNSLSLEQKEQISKKLSWDFNIRLSVLKEQ